MTFKEEFEKAFHEHYYGLNSNTHPTTIAQYDQAKEEVLWAARWMAERCALCASDGNGAMVIRKSIRQLAKELK